MVLDRFPEESSDIVPVLLYSCRQECMVGVPVLLQSISKDVEHLVVDVLVNTCSALEAFNYQSQAYLGVLKTDSDILFEERRKGLLLVSDSFLIQVFYQVVNLLVIQIQNVTVKGVEEPVLSLIADLHSIQAHPVVCDCQHEADYQRPFTLIFFEVFDKFVELSSLLVAQKQVLVLELPCERVQLKLLVLAEDCEVLEPLEAKFVIAPFEISIQDILFSPRPLFPQLMLLLKPEKKALNPSLESPERRATQNVVVRLTSFDEVQKAQCIECSMITAKIRCVLHMALALIDVVSRIVCVSDQISQGNTWNFLAGTADIGQNAVQDLIPKLSYFFGNNSHLKPWHKSIELYLRISVWVVKKGFLGQI